jgi:hypothetical protein
MSLQKIHSVCHWGNMPFIKLILKENQLKTYCLPFVIQSECEGKSANNQQPITNRQNIPPRSSLIVNRSSTSTLSSLISPLHQIEIQIELRESSVLSKPFLSNLSSLFLTHTHPHTHTVLPHIAFAVPGKYKVVSGTPKAILFAHSTPCIRLWS